MSDKSASPAQISDEQECNELCGAMCSHKLRDQAELAKCFARSRLEPVEAPKLSDEFFEAINAQRSMPNREPVEAVSTTPKWLDSPLAPSEEELKDYATSFKVSTPPSKEFDPELHAASIACKCNMSRPCATCVAAWHQAWDVAEGKIASPEASDAPSLVVQPPIPAGEPALPMTVGNWTMEEWKAAEARVFAMRVLYKPDSLSAIYKDIAINLQASLTQAVEAPSALREEVEDLKCRYGEQIALKQKMKDALLSAKLRYEKAEKTVAGYNSGGFSDADAVMDKYLDEHEKLAEAILLIGGFLVIPAMTTDQRQEMIDDAREFLEEVGF